MQRESQKDSPDASMELAAEKFGLIASCPQEVWMVAADWLEESGECCVTAQAMRAGIYSVSDRGDGSGSGSGDGSGYGYGSGDGYGYGDGYGDGSGDGDGSGY